MVNEWKRGDVRRLYAGGMKTAQIARAVGCSQRTVFRIIAERHGTRRPSQRQLSLAEREEISRGLKAEVSYRSIARQLGRAASSVLREVRAHGRYGYRAWAADARAELLSARPRPGKLDGPSPLRRIVEELLERKWSPAQIANRLKVDYPNDPAMQVSYETIYKALYVQGRGSLRKELTKHLRQARSIRRPKGKKPGVRGRIVNMVNISQRPPEIADRAVPGHWEGDLIVGRQGNSMIGTLVERSSRYVMLLHLPGGKSAQHVREALTTKIQQLPRELRRSLTWDQGKELAQHTQFTVDTGVKVFFCDPHSPWQRGSNENANGLLRQYFPKGTDLSRFDAEQLDAVAREMNGRPRQTLGWRTPAEKLDELLTKSAA